MSDVQCGVFLSQSRSHSHVLTILSQTMFPIKTAWRRSATATQLPTAAAGVSGDHSRTLSELHHNDRESAPVIIYLLFFQAHLSQ